MRIGFSPALVVMTMPPLPNVTVKTSLLGRVLGVEQRVFGSVRRVFDADERVFPRVARPFAPSPSGFGRR